MRGYIAFLKKEFMEMVRTGKLITLGIIFVLFGIMNPAIAKFTPELMKMVSESLEEAGMVVGEVTVSDLTSWMQFYKNVPMALIIFVVMFSGIITAEYQKGTIIPMLTKGISPAAVFFAKYTAVFLAWTAGYALTFGITCFYNEYYWENAKTCHIIFNAVCCYVLGVLVLSVMMLAAALFENNTSVMVITVVAALGVYLLSMIPDFKDYLPTKLMASNDLMTGKLEPSDYTVSMVITLAVSFVCVVISGFVIKKKAV